MQAIRSSEISRKSSKEKDVTGLSDIPNRPLRCCVDFKSQIITVTLELREEIALWPRQAPNHQLIRNLAWKSVYAI